MFSGQIDAIAQHAVAGGYNLVWAVSSIAELDVAQRYGLRVMWGGASDQATIIQIREPDQAEEDHQ